MKGYYPLNYFDINGIIRQNPSLIIKANASHSYPNCHATNILNSETGNKCWHSGNVQGASIQISISDYWIYITNYSMQAPDIGKCTNGNHFPKQWILEGYDDEKHEWNLISNITESILNSSLKIKVFNINNNKKGFYQQFKFTSTGLDYYGSGSNHFIIQAIDLWGTLCTSKTNCKEKHNFVVMTCQNSKQTVKIHICIYSFIIHHI